MFSPGGTAKHRKSGLLGMSDGYLHDSQGNETAFVFFLPSNPDEFTKQVENNHLYDDNHPWVWIFHESELEDIED